MSPKELKDGCSQSLRVSWHNYYVPIIHQSQSMVVVILKLMWRILELIVMTPLIR